MPCEPTNLCLPPVGIPRYHMGMGGKRPERLALSGGTGRIRVFGIPDFDHADITLHRQANITYSMVKIISLVETGNNPPAEGQSPPHR